MMGNGGDSAVLKKGTKEGQSITGTTWGAELGVRVQEGVGAAEHLVGAGRRSKAGVHVWTAGLRVRDCLSPQQQGFILKSLHAATGRRQRDSKNASDIGKMFSCSFRIYCISTVVALNGTGKKQEQLARMVFLADIVTANYFRQRSWCGLITGGTFWL